jgi:hypothetical protein
VHDLVGLYRFALRSGNRPLARELAAILRREPDLRERADRELSALPRGPARWSAAGERALHRVLERLAAIAL